MAGLSDSTPQDPIVSVITAVHPDARTYLLETWESLKKQKVDGGWEWLLQEDSAEPTPEIASLADSDPRISYCHNGHSQGATETRNLALSRARGLFVRNLDADDLLPDDCLSRSVAILMDNEEVQYVVGPIVDLFPDGSLHEFPDNLDPGPIQPGVLFRHWVNRNFFGVVHPTCILIRTDILLALGGWMAVGQSEDTGLLMAVSQLTLGWQTDFTLLHYRKHEAQLTKSDWALTKLSRSQRFGTIRRRAEVIAETIRVK